MALCVFWAQSSNCNTTSLIDIVITLRAQINLGVDDVEQIELIFNAERLPRRPYCSDDLRAGLSIRAFESAIRKKYIQVNPPQLFFWLVLDVDRPAGALAWEQPMLPMPNFAVTNKQNGHAHLFYGLAAPVLTTEAARQAPLRYLNSIKNAYTDLAKADRAYAGLTSKNPFSPSWGLLQGHTRLFDMAELGEYVPDLSRYSGSAKSEDQAGIGRNVAVFELVRKWSYREIRLFRGAGRLHFNVWSEHVLNRVLTINGDFPEPLPFSECKAIAKSIAKWVWARDPAAEQSFKIKQAARGQQGGLAKGRASEEKRATARLMAAKGVVQSVIANELGVTRETVNRWLKRV